jgi:hypothetical protein
MVQPSVSGVTLDTPFRRNPPSGGGGLFALQNPAEREVLQFAVRVARQESEPHIARVLVWAQDPLDVILDLLGLGGVARHAVAEHHEGAHDRAALGVRAADDRGLEDVGVSVDGGLDLGTAGRS